tara:strand:- start:1435 stop:1836 length:402 start_codon:yes stop_codon:yes gene_type:complete
MKANLFQLGLRSITAAQPFGKKLKDDEIQFLWLTLPQTVKDAVSDEVWAYACNQALMDPDPNKELPVHYRILSYVYRLENSQPNFEWGLKADLHDRMLSAARFNPQGLPELPAEHPDQFLPVTNPLLKGAFND